MSDDCDLILRSWISGLELLLMMFLLAIFILMSPIAGFQCPVAVFKLLVSACRGMSSWIFTVVFLFGGFHHDAVRFRFSVTACCGHWSWCVRCCKFYYEVACCGFSSWCLPLWIFIVMPLWILIIMSLVSGFVDVVS